MGIVTASRPVGPASLPKGQSRLLLVAGTLAASLLLAAALRGEPSLVALLLLVEICLVGALTHRVLLRWHVLASAIVLCILLIPIGRYELLGSLPFNIEPYRLLVAAVTAAWLASLLAQPDTRWQRTEFFLPLLVVMVSVLSSVALNVSRLSEPGVEESVIKNTSMFLSFFVVMLFVSSVIRTREQLYVVLKAMIGGGGLVGLLGLVQYRTGFNAFDHLQHVIPVLHVNAAGLPSNLEDRGGGARVYASASHPIAFSAAMVMLVPVSFFVAKTFRRRRWWLATVLIVMAALAAVARTGSLMLLVELVTMLCLKPRAVLRLWPYAIPLLIAVHFAAPQALGGLKSAFFPSGGIVADQHASAGTVGSGRLADIGPSLSKWAEQPVFGQGYGTRITDPFDPHMNAFILDDQWLASLLEVGAVGVLALLWLFVRSIKRLCGAARRDNTQYGWLLAALAASITSFAVGMITFDAFAFFQVTFICFVMLGLAIPAVRLSTATGSETPSATTRRQASAR